MRVRFSSPLPSEGPNERHLSTSRDLSTFSADRQLATPPFRVVRGSARALWRARWSRGRRRSWKHQHGPPADFGTASWRCGQGSRRQRHHPSPRKPRRLSGEHFRTARFRRTVLWLVIHRGSARFEGPADELPSGSGQRPACGGANVGIEQAAAASPLTEEAARLISGAYGRVLDTAG